MSDDKKTSGTLSLGGTLSLDKPATPVSGGKPNVPVVKKRKRVIRPNADGTVTAPSANSPAGITLSQAEIEARQRALAGKEAVTANAERNRQQVEIQNEKRRLVEKADEQEEQVAQQAQQAEAKSDTPVEESSQSISLTPESDSKPVKEHSSVDRTPAFKKPAVAPQPEKKQSERKNRKGVEQRRKGGKINVNQFMLDDDGDTEFMEQRGRSLAAIKRRREKEKQQAREALQEKKKIYQEVVIPETILVGELANRMNERGADVIKTLMKMGVMATQNQSIDADTAELVVTEMGHTVKRVSEQDIEQAILDMVQDNPDDMEPRAPVVTIMGHVDHGKTSLLDALRSTDIVAGEAGGITQHIGAYMVTLGNGNQISFLDTPGHAAFTEMRMRGAMVTDIVILVVAADDGISPQTVEAINHAKAANVPIIVAINKCDKPDAAPERVHNQLLEHELITENFGGEVQAVEVSAKEHMNLDKLQEAILLQAEMMGLKANANRDAQGTVVEARLEKGRGSVATILVQKGTLKVGDVFVVGKEYGRVRALVKDNGQRIKTAGPSVPVEVLGLNGTPMAGDELTVVQEESQAREVASYRAEKEKQAKNVVSAQKGTLEHLFSQIKAGETQEMPMIIKADAQGSLEAIRASLDKMATDEVKIRILHGAVGGITQSDVTLAGSTGGVIIGFNVRADVQARDIASRDGIDIRYYSIIYDLIDDAKALLGGLLAPEVREDLIGYAEIRDVFTISKVGKVGGCYVTEGKFARGSKVRLLRDNVVIHEGTLKQLRRFKEEVKEVAQGYECGMQFENYEDIKVGDFIECFEVTEIQRQL